MEIKVKSSYLKISPRKLLPNLYGVRGQNAEKAEIQLNFTNTKGAKLLAALVKSAIAIGKENDLETEKLYIKSVFCTEGPRLKRRQIKARGRSDQIIKRMSHIQLVVSDEASKAVVNPEKKEIKPKAKKEKVIKANTEEKE